MMMRTFSLLIHDTRYSVPTLEFAEVADEMAAQELAAVRLAASGHHLAVEVYEGERPLFRYDHQGVVRFSFAPGPHRANAPPGRIERLCRT